MELRVASPVGYSPDYSLDLDIDSDIDQGTVGSLDCMNYYYYSTK